MLRLEADAATLAALIRSERDGDLLAAELVDRQDEILALYDLARSSRNKIDLPLTLQTVAAEMGRLLKADLGFIALLPDDGQPHVVTSSDAPLEPGRIGGWLDKIRRTTQGPRRPGCRRVTLDPSRLLGGRARCGRATPAWPRSARRAPAGRSARRTSSCRWPSPSRPAR